MLPTAAVTATLATAKSTAPPSNDKSALAATAKSMRKTVELFFVMSLP
jgi:hypothetical protein